MTGHIRRRGQRSWEIKWDAGNDPATGKRKTRYASVKGTKREAEAELVRLMAAQKSGQAAEPSKITVKEFFDHWDRDWASLNVTAKTLERYRELTQLHVVAHLGATALQKLRPANLAALYTTLLREGKSPRRKPKAGEKLKNQGLSPRTVGHVHRVAHRAFGHAVQWGLITVNPAANVSPPPVASTEIEILRPDDLKKVLAHVKGTGLQFLTATVLGTGMRRGELLALRWLDLDLDRSTLRVQRSLEETSAGLRFKAPKTKHGRRTISLPAYLVGELRSHWKAQIEARLSLGLGKPSPEALVFPRFDGEPRSPDSLSKEWKAAATAAGAPVTLHALRHTHASQLIASGLDVLTISRRLGHGNPNITLTVYGHLFASTDDRAAKVLDAAFSAATE